MKMHVLTATILAALGARAVLAASEGGDTWSAVQPLEQSTDSLLQYTSRLDLSQPASDDPLLRSEGGDTWSSVQALRDATGQPSVVQDHLDRADTKYAGQSGGSEGGDTWSRFVPQFQSQPVGSADMASTRDGTRDHWQPAFGE